MSENQKLTVKARSWSTGWLFNKKAFVLLVTMTLMVSMGFESVNYIPLKSDGIDMENDMPNRGTHHYKIKVGNDFQSGQDLVITAKAVGARSDPDLYISSSEDPAPSRQNNEYACAMVGDDVCTIPSKEIYQDKTFYVTVSCFKK